MDLSDLLNSNTDSEWSLPVPEPEPLSDSDDSLVIKQKKRKRPSATAEPPQKRARVAPAAAAAAEVKRSSDEDDLFGDAEAAAAAENKNGAPLPGAKSKSMLREDSGLPDWKKVDDLEPEPTDDPEYIPMLGLGAAGSNTYLDDWMKAAYDLFWNMDILHWTLELQRLYNRNLYCWYQDDPAIPRERPFYRSAIFTYFDKHKRPAWFVKGVRLVTMRYHLQRMDCTVIAMENGEVLNPSKENIASYEKMFKLVTLLENEVAKLKKS